MEFIRCEEHIECQLRKAHAERPLPAGRWLQRVHIAGHPGVGSFPAAVFRAACGRRSNTESVKVDAISQSPGGAMRSLLIGLVLVLAGCQQIPLTPEDIQARKFEPVPDKAVIYLVRDNPDFSTKAARGYLKNQFSHTEKFSDKYGPSST
jgi:hypothetical protein